MVYIPPLKPLGCITTVDDKDPRYIARINEEIPLSDGGRIRANVFFPRSGGPRWPVLMTATPYGKDVPYARCSAYKKSAELIPQEHHCDHLAWEAPSPAYWCPRGYAVVICDQRGTGNSPGHLRLFSTQNFDDYATAITWAADQEWSTGKVGLTGISYLALNQWPTAARQPRGLACIVPWEGMADWYRDASRHGGIFCDGFARSWFSKQIKPIQYGSRDREAGGFGPDSTEGTFSDEILAENIDVPGDSIRGNEFIGDQYYADKMVHEDYSRIQVPLLSVGNWGGLNLHLRGNVLGYMRAGSQEKFVRIHTGRHDLPYYAEPYISTQRSFYDCYLKDDDYAGWRSGQQAPVAFAVRRGTHSPNSFEAELKHEWRNEQEWPIARTRYEKRFLAAEGLLDAARPNTETMVGNGVSFHTLLAETEYEICGHITLRLSVSLTNRSNRDCPAEIDIFAALRKISQDGEESTYTSSTGDPTAVTFGWIRASHRTLTTTPYPGYTKPLPFPTLSHLRRDAKEVIEGEIYDLQCELWPTNVVVQKGERLVLEVAPKDPRGTSFFTCADSIDR
ncbi:hypothetical protein BDW74DRAFT_187347 [Aspergillus multicolor]|uniref:uncharacterized protein n=1 Tax=Aspergillus multicolor TaxID=41759 RepID=UPI003CCD6BC0